jgi:hypothetical protein
MLPVGLAIQPQHGIARNLFIAGLQTAKCRT